MVITNFSLLASSKVMGMDIVAVSLTPFHSHRNNHSIMTELCPSNLLVRRLHDNKITHAEFEASYHDTVLAKLDAKEVYAKLEGKIVCDWYAMDAMSPKRMLANWIESELGITIEEFSHHPIKRVSNYNIPFHRG